MATPDTDFDAQDAAEAFDETHNTDEDGAPTETRSFDLLDDVYDATRAEGDQDEDGDVLDASDYDPDDLDDEDLDEEDDDAAVFLDDDDELDDEDEDEEDDELHASSDNAELEYTDDIDGVGRANNRQSRRFESSHELSQEQVDRLGYSAPAATDRPEEITGSGACADDVEDESHPRQEALLDEGIEETFPASDPVSVKHIT